MRLGCIGLRGSLARKIAAVIFGVVSNSPCFASILFALVVMGPFPFLYAARLECPVSLRFIQTGCIPGVGKEKNAVWGGLEKMTGYVASDDSLFSGRCWDILCGMTGCFLSGTVTFFFLFRAVCPLLIPSERGFSFCFLKKTVAD